MPMITPACVLVACLALSAASITGIGALRSGRRFGLTAASVCLAVVCLVMNNIASSQPPKPPTFALAGTVTIEQSSSDLSNCTPLIAATGQGCQGAGGYSDLSADTAVVVTDSQGRQVAVGAMQAGRLAGGHRNWCLMPFSVRGVPRGLSTYSVTISHRGAEVYTPEEAQAGVALEIGP
jgi:hypothetical protein